MTKEEAITILQHLAEIIRSGDYQETFKMAASALRPVSREHAEKMWKGRWITVSNTAGETWSKCSECQEELDGLEDAYNFCPRCGAPMTYEAVDMVMERWEAAYD